MNEKQKDKGLMKAMKDQPQFQLPSNFTFRTMKKVEQSILQHEKKVEQRTLLAIIVASLFLIASCISYLYIYLGDYLKEHFPHTLSVGKEVLDMQIPSVYILIMAMTPLLMLFDRWMRKQYFRHHS